MIAEALKLVSARQNLTPAQAGAVMDEMMTGQASPVLMAAFLAALATKGETVEEISALADGMRRHCIRFPHTEPVFEIVGTGGDGANSFNISTTSAFVIAAAGVAVAKHGNRAASSKSGAADVLEALGANISLSPEQNTAVLKKTNICFLFAQRYHSSMRFVGPVRKELGIRTVFNILGPLTNPAFAEEQILGVYSADLVEPLAKVLMNLGVKQGLSVYGTAGLDEISAAGETRICDFGPAGIKNYSIKPEDFGLAECTREDLRGGDPAYNARITRDVLNGKKGPQRDTVIMNAGCGLYVTGKTRTIADGVKQAAGLIDSGRAAAVLNTFIAATNTAGEKV